MATRLWSATRDQLNFFRIHLLLFILFPLLASLVFYAFNDTRSPNDAFVSYIDSLFLCISAVTVAGLFSVVLSNITVGQQVILALLTAVGSYSFVSTAMVVIRRHYFSKEMERHLVERQIRAERERAERLQAAKERLEIRGFAEGPILDGGESTRTCKTEPRPGVEMRRRTVTIRSGMAGGGVPLPRTDTRATALDRGYGGFAFPSLKDITRKISRFRKRDSNEEIGNDSADSSLLKQVPYFSFGASVGRNSTFHDLSQEEKEELGGVELAALDMLAWIVPSYWVLVQLFSFVVLAPYMARSEFHEALTTGGGQAAPVNPTWFTVFQILSSYANNGMSLVDASLVELQWAYLLQIMMMFLILAGNTAFPCFLRVFIWLGSKCYPKSSKQYATLRFILDHPRRCFLYLFPSTETWYLAAVLISLNAVDWLLFLLLDINNPPIQSIPIGTRIIAGLFQAVAVRCGGFQIVILGTLAPAVQVLYVVMMYVGALPLALGVRSTNVYEDRSIAVFEQELDEEPPVRVNVGLGMTKSRLRGEYIKWHLKRQLSFDLWWLALALILICAFERGQIMDPQRNSFINPFSVLFEIVSAYGTVGLSLGVPGQNYSLSGVLGKPSKLVLCAVMLRGRHRGLPAAIDRSVLLPGQKDRQDLMDEQYQQRQATALHALRAQESDFGAVGQQTDCPPGLA